MISVVLALKEYFICVASFSHSWIRPIVISHCLFLRWTRACVSGWRISGFLGSIHPFRRFTFMPLGKKEKVSYCHSKFYFILIIGNWIFGYILNKYKAKTYFFNSNPVLVCENWNVVTILVGGRIDDCPCCVLKLEKNHRVLFRWLQLGQNIIVAKVRKKDIPLLVFHIVAIHWLRRGVGKLSGIDYSVVDSQHSCRRWIGGLLKRIKIWFKFKAVYIYIFVYASTEKHFRKKILTLNGN